MTRTRVFFMIAVVALAVSASWLAELTLRPAQAGPAKTGDHGHGHGDHVHAAVPAAYATAHIPPGVWTDPKVIAKGKEIFAAKCAVCHGVKGDGKGPGAANLPLKPADFTDGKVVAEMAASYWVWRVSEGGLVEPFRSKGSAYAAGLGVPFLLSALAVDRFLVFFGRFRPFLPVVDRVAGVLLVGVGLLLALNYMTILNAYFISLTPQWLLERL